MQNESSTETKPRAHYYYIRKRSKHDQKMGWRGVPIITVCLYKEGPEKDWVRGVSICSQADNPCKRTGRTVALNRAKIVSESGASITCKDYLSSILSVFNGDPHTPFTNDTEYIDDTLLGQLLAITGLTFARWEEGKRMLLGVAAPALTEYEQELIALCDRRIKNYVSTPVEVETAKTESAQS